MERTENTYSIILKDYESEDLYHIAEVTTYWDIERIKKISQDLYNEYSEGTNERVDFYEELGERTWLNIYTADVLDI